MRLLQLLPRLNRRLSFSSTGAKYSSPRYSRRIEALPIETFAVLGAQVWHLRHVEGGWQIRLPTGGGVLDVIEQCHSHLVSLGLPVTERAGRDVWAIETELRNEDEDAVLTHEHASRLSDAGRRLWDTFQAEAGGKVAYVASDKRYAVQRLLDDVGSLMAPDTFDRLPPIAQYDMTEAGTCIAFERPTAAAFHVLRATEATLRHFYRSFVRRGRIQQPWMWAAVVTDLRARRTPPPTELLDQLDAMRRNFRNPTQHPEKIFRVDEVQDLFASAVDVMNRMTASPRWLPPN